MKYRESNENNLMLHSGKASSIERNPILEEPYVSKSVALESSITDSCNQNQSYTHGSSRGTLVPGIGKFSCTDYLARQMFSLRISTHEESCELDSDNSNIIVNLCDD